MASAKKTLQLIRDYPRDLDPRYQVFVENVPLDVGKYDLAVLYSVHGRPFAAFVKTVSSGGTAIRKWAFIAFMHGESALRAVRNDDSEIEKLGMKAHPRLRQKGQSAQGNKRFWKQPWEILEEDRRRRECERMWQASFNAFHGAPPVVLVNGVPYAPVGAPYVPVLVPAFSVPVDNSAFRGGGGGGDGWATTRHGAYGGFRQPRETRRVSTFCPGFDENGKLDLSRFPSLFEEMDGNASGVGGNEETNIIPAEGVFAPAVNPVADDGGFDQGRPMAPLDVQLPVDIGMQIEKTGSGLGVITGGCAVVADDFYLGGVIQNSRPGRDLAGVNVSSGPGYALTPNTLAGRENQDGGGLAFAGGGPTVNPGGVGAGVGLRGIFDPSDDRDRMAGGGDNGVTAVSVVGTGSDTVVEGDRGRQGERVAGGGRARGGADELPVGGLAITSGGAYKRSGRRLVIGPSGPGGEIRATTQPITEEIMPENDVPVVDTEEVVYLDGKMSVGDKTGNGEFEVIHDDENVTFVRFYAPAKDEAADGGQGGEDRRGPGV